MDKLWDLFVGDIPHEQRKAFTRIFFRGFFLFHVVWACGWLAIAGLPGFAQAGEVQSVKKELTERIDRLDGKISNVEASVVHSQKIQQRTAYEVEVRRLDQEIFNTTSRIKELQTAGIRVDQLYDERLNDLQSERERVQSRLVEFLRANPDIAGATF